MRWGASLRASVSPTHARWAGRHHPAGRGHAHGEHGPGLEREGQALVARRAARDPVHLLAPAGERVGRVEVVVARRRRRRGGPGRPSPRASGAGRRGACGRRSPRRRRRRRTARRPARPRRRRRTRPPAPGGSESASAASRTSRRPGSDHVGQVRERDSLAHRADANTTPGGRPPPAVRMGPDPPDGDGRRAPDANDFDPWRSTPTRPRPRAAPGRGRPPGAPDAPLTPAGSSVRAALQGPSSGISPGHGPTRREDVAMLARGPAAPGTSLVPARSCAARWGSADRFCKLPRGRRRSRTPVSGGTWTAS